MLKLFRRLRDLNQKAVPQATFPNLFCIHISKTAGGTCRQALKSHCGENGVLTLDYQSLEKRGGTLMTTLCINIQLYMGTCTTTYYSPILSPLQSGLSGYAIRQTGLFQTIITTRVRFFLLNGKETPLLSSSV